MKKQFWFGVLLGALFTIVIGGVFTIVKDFLFSNRSVYHLRHPSVNKKVSVLVLGGVSNDVSYVMPGYVDTKSLPESNFLCFKDSFSISYDDSSLVIYCLNEPHENQLRANEKIKLEILSRLEYHAMDSLQLGRLLYRYYF
ncbi:MAG: hypothetical protein L0Y80_06725 [Ignavibacteriae bacterium]|nr:hypothetical protein [Ignavibacteriota bacterium]